MEGFTMSDKEFGIKFTKTDNGFRIEANGNDEMVNAHHEMVDAWREFMNKARQVAKTHDHHHDHHGCCEHEVKKENTDINAE